jgi:hypothetical protein
MGREMERCLTDQAVSIVGVPARNLQDMAAQGKIPGAAKIGKRWTFDILALKRWTKTRKKEQDKRVRIPEKGEPVVYFVRVGRYVKIGSTRDFPRRIVDIQIGSAEELELLCTIPGDHKKEKELHQKFRNAHLRGEWFAISDELRGFVLQKTGRPLW